MCEIQVTLKDKPTLDRDLRFAIHYINSTDPVLVLEQGQREEGVCTLVLYKLVRNVLL